MEDSAAQMKILARMPNWVGDCLMATPALRALRQKYPEARVSVLVASHLVPLFEKNPYVHEIIPFEVRGWRGLKKRWELAKELRRAQFDEAVIFPRSWDSALVPFLARIPQRVGYANAGRACLLTRSTARRRALRRAHQAQYYWNLVTGSPELPPQEQRADLIIPEQVASWAREYFKTYFDSKKVVGLAPGATYGSAKMWLPGRYWELAAALLRDPKIEVVFFGHAKEREWIEEKKPTASRARILAGKTTLLELAALLRQCRVVVTNDSGPMHVAAAVGVPLIALFGPTRYETTHPLGAHTLIHKRVSCSPCLLRHCPIDHRCMTQISVEEVGAAVLKKLSEI